MSPLRCSVVVKDLRLNDEDKDKEKDLMSKDEDKNEDRSSRYEDPRKQAL